MLLLADEYFFSTHDAASGRRRLSEHTAALGLAGALLGELLLSRKITITGGQITVIDLRPPEDPLVGTILRQLVGDSEVTDVRDWLRYLAQNTYELVAKRLLLAGRVHRQTSWQPWRQATYPPNDPNIAVLTAARLTTRLTRHEPLTTPDAVLAGLMVATGVEKYLVLDAPAEVSGYLRQVLATALPPPFAELIDETAAAVGDAVLSHRA